jgi:putative PIN family toxin of toxin-antitoxin system
MTAQLFIIDTNVLVAGLLTRNPESPTVSLLNAMLEGGLFFLLSPALLQEYREVLARPRLMSMHGLTHDEIDHLLTDLTANALWREPPADGAQRAPEPGDTHLWALLAAEPTAILVTGDKLLLDNPEPGRSVITPSGCFDLLAKR